MEVRGVQNSTIKKLYTILINIIADPTMITLSFHLRYVQTLVQVPVISPLKRVPINRTTLEKFLSIKQHLNHYTP